MCRMVLHEHGDGVGQLAFTRCVKDINMRASFILIAFLMGRIHQFTQHVIPWLDIS
jgi:hypothetical protein